MQSIAYRTRLARWTSPPTPIARALTTAVIAAALLTQAACGDSSPTAVIPPDASLVGTWNGGIMRSIDDTPVTFTLTLKADSTGSAVPQGANPDCAAVGPWTVSNGRFTLSSRDCNGSSATFTAPVTVGVSRMSGTWSTATLNGTFDVTKH
jgi:hypothetical protein